MLHCEIGPLKNILRFSGKAVVQNIWIEFSEEFKRQDESARALSVGPLGRLDRVAGRELRSVHLSVSCFQALRCDCFAQ